MSLDKAIKDMGPDELYGLCTRFLKAQGLKIISVKREKDIWIETMGAANGKKELFFVKRGDLKPEDLRSMPKNTRVRIVTLGDVRTEERRAEYPNIELIDSKGFTAMLEETRLLVGSPPKKGLPSLGEVEMLLKTANESFARKEYDRALELYSRVLSMKSSLAPVWAAKGDICHILKNYADALECYKRALQIDVKNGKYWFKMASALYYLKRYEEEVECYDMAIKNDPSLLEAWNNKGIAIHQLGKYEEALLCYDMVLKKNPNNELAWNNKALALKKLNRTQEALTCFNKALELRNDFLDALVNKGVLLYELKGYREALVYFEKALELSIDASTLYHHGMTLSKLKDYDGARTSLRKASEELPRAKAALKRIERHARRGAEKTGAKAKRKGGAQGRPCLGEYEENDKGCRSCTAKNECRVM